jgi:TolB-like protein/tRNA A-37 threonylcarbamoyl transferase component Bud32/Flp pilus assembly protein TadD
MTDMLRDWPRVKAVFEQAVSLDAAQRSAFLASACGSDEVLRRHVDALLASHDSSQSFLEQNAGMVLDLGGTDLCGRTIGTYKLLARIGAGAMGEVYLAQDEKLNRRVAVKLIAKHLADDSDRLRRFRHEAHAASSLNHPHIVVVHDFGDTDGRPFIVTELVEGETLRARLERGPLPISEAIGIALQAAGALSAAHAGGLVHRDIKPENVMVRRDGYVKVLDFGLAKLAGESAPTAAVQTFATRGGHAAGTPSYMSPEQARAEMVDARTDVFSLGAVLYEMVTGQLAFPGNSHAVIFSKILGETPRPAAEITPQVPADLERIIAKALEKDRELRYQSAADMRVDLLRLGRESQAGLAAAPRPTAARVRRWAMLGLAALIVIAVAYVARPRDSAPPPTRATRAMLAVLPFEDLSDDRREDYFADGLTDEMIAHLGELQPASLGVIARKSTVRYKNTKQTAAQIGKELGVDYLLEGSVRRAGDRVRVITQLVNAAEQTHLWSETYEGTVSDVLSIQAEIADELTRSLSIQLLPRAANPPPRTINLKSYDKYLLGLHELRKGTRESGANAIAYFKEGIANDPGNARIHAALGQAYTAVVTYHASPAEVMPLARESAQRALALDPGLAAAHVTLGNVLLLFDWDWAAAEKEYLRALEINPNLPEAQLGYATYLATLGRFDDAIARVQQAYLFDPLAIENRNEALWIYYYSGRMRDLVDQSRRTIQIEPAAGLPYAMLALAHAHLGERAEALKAAAAAERPNSPTVMTTTASALAQVGREKEARRLLTRALALAKDRYVCRFIVAAAYMDLGDSPAAFASLEEAFQHRST